MKQETITIPNQLRKEDVRFVKLFSKVPFEKDWQNKGYKFNDPGLLKHIEKNNYGVIGGFGNLRIIDVDDPKLIDEFDVETFTVKTGGGGRHFYFISDYDTNHVFASGRGEVRAKAYQVVGAGCLHPNGKRYKIIKDCSIKKLSKEKFRKLIEPYLRTEIDNTSPEKPKAADTTRSGREFGEVCKLIKKGLTKEAVFERMKAFVKWSEAPPQYQEMTYNKAFKKSSPEKYEKEIEKPPEILQFFEDPENLRGFIPKRMADKIKSKYVFKTPNDTEEIHYYIDGIYKPGRHLIKIETRNILGEKTKNYHIGETVGSVTQTTYINRDEINTNHILIPIMNGLLNLETLDVIPHSPEYFFTFKLPVNYKKGLKCPKFLEWLEERLREGDSEDYLWKIDTIQEFFGYCLLKDIRFQKALMLRGRESTGKSTLLTILTTMLGQENIKTMPLQHITNNIFAPAYLQNILANICPDLDASGLKNVGKFLSLTGDKYGGGAKKNEHEVSFKNISKLIFSCNKLPRTPRKGLEFYRRWIYIEFNKVIDQENIRPGLEEELIKEIDGVFVWAVDGLRRLIKNNGFKSYPYSKHDIKKLWERHSNSVDAFIEDEIELTDEFRSITKREVYSRYKKYCIENESSQENQIFFGRLFNQVTGCGGGKKDGLPAYKGVSFKNTQKEQQKIGV